MTPAEITAAIQAFQILEPLAQQAIAALIHKVQKKTLTAEDYLAQAAALMPTPKG